MEDFWFNLVLQGYRLLVSLFSVCDPFSTFFHKNCEYLNVVLYDIYIFILIVLLSENFLHGSLQAFI